MKFSGFTLFMLLLVLLIVSVLFCRCCMQYSEGFIAYQEKLVTLDQTIIPMYSDQHKLHKLYDSLYFDNKNGNLIEVEGSEYLDNVTTDTPTTTGKVDVTGSTIKELHIVPRQGNSVNSYTIDNLQTQLPAPITATVNSYQSKVYRTKNENVNAGEYTVFMMPWHENTYIHVMTTPNAEAISASSIEVTNAKRAKRVADQESASTPSSDILKATANEKESELIGKIATANELNPRNIGTYGFTYQSSAIDYTYTDANNTAMNNIVQSRTDNSEKKDTMVIEPLYNTTTKVYKISEFVHFDIRNGHLLVNNSVNTIDIYGRNGTIISNISELASGEATTNGDLSLEITNVDFLPRIIYDVQGQNMILYIPNARKTLVALIHYNNEGYLVLRNVCRFHEKGIDHGEPDTGYDDNNDDNDYARDGYRDIDRDNKLTDYSDFDLSDYMLKTQVVPPVCPACPACNYNAGNICGQCGGNGGCGTKTIDGKSLVTGSNIISDTVNTTDNVLNKTVDTAGNVVIRTVDAAGNIVNRTVDAAGNLVTGTVDTAGKFASGAVDAAGNVVGSTVDAAGNIISGAFGMVGKVLGSANQDYRNTSTPISGQQQSGVQSGQQQYGGTNNVMDPYSYQGKLPAKKSNEFMPITADFSSFGR